MGFLGRFFRGEIQQAVASAMSSASGSGAPRQVSNGAAHYYDALTDSKDRTPIPAFSLALRAVLQSFSRQRLAFLGRYLYDNDGIVAYAVDQIANYSVPIIPMASTADPEANKVYEAYFDEWCKRADFTGRFHFGTLQRLVCKAIDTDGDIAATITDANGFPQLQLFETWRISSPNIADKGSIDGVRVNSNGVVQGYDLTAPKLSGENQSPIFIPADELILLYDADRYGSYRGVTPIRRGMNDVRDAKDIKGFEKLATKIGAALAAVIEGADLEEENVWGDDKPLPPDATEQEKKFGVADLLGGDIITLPNGKKLHQLDNSRPGERVMEMLEYLGGCFVSGLGVPPAFFLQRKFTGPNQRSVNGQAQRKFNQRQELLAAFLEWVWVRVIGWGITFDGLPVVSGWNGIEWQGPPKVSIDEGADAAAWRDDVACGLMTRQNHFANRALNWQRETDQGFAEDAYILTKANELAAKQKIPVELILARWGYSAARPQPVKPENETNKPPANRRAAD